VSFELQFAPAEIPALAARFGGSGDDACLRAGAAARARGRYTRGELVLLCAWKSRRSRPLVARNSPGRIARATSAAFAAAAGEAERIEALLGLDGVGVPSASVLLHFWRPDAYPILDVRAVESLGVKGRSGYPVSFWLRYAAACRALAAAHGVTLRTLDKALWQHSKERAGMTSEVIAERPDPK
jgi:hypothetical protein